MWWFRLLIVSNFSPPPSQAEERNDSARTASVDVSIKVLDINDHPPQFLLLQYSVQVPESAELGRVVVTATAFDPDEVCIIIHVGIYLYTAGVSSVL